MRNDDAAHSYKTFNGRFVFFEGRESPSHGFKLVSAPWIDIENGRKSRRDKAREVKAVATFSHLSILSGGGYTLDQVSPDGHFVLVQFSEGTRAKAGRLPGMAHQYFIVNVETGEKHLLLRDEVQNETIGFLDQVWWVRSGGGAP